MTIGLKIFFAPKVLWTNDVTILSYIYLNYFVSKFVLSKSLKNLKEYVLAFNLAEKTSWSKQKNYWERHVGEVCKKKKKKKKKMVSL